MPRKREISETAKWFLNNLQRLQNDFAEVSGVQIVTINLEGDLITERSGGQKVYKLILSTEEGEIRLRDTYKVGISLIRNKKETVFMNCFAGFACVFVPIILKGKLIGAIVSCGGRHERGESKEKLREKFSKLANELGVREKEDFLRAAIDEVEPVTEEELKKRAGKLAKLIEILAETAVTPLKEVFG